MPTQEDLSSEYLDYIIATKFNRYDQSVFSELSLILNNCFVASKINNLTVAHEYYTSSKDFIKNVSPSLSPWVESFLGQRVSYFYYKKGEFDKAISKSKEIAEASQKLFTEGYQFLFFSEIQQLYNCSRIYFSKNQYSDAIELAICALERIANQSNNWDRTSFIDNDLIKENLLVSSAEFTMFNSIVLESLGRILTTFENNKPLVKYWVGHLIDHLWSYNALLVETDDRFATCYIFIGLLKKVLIDEVDEISDSEASLIQSVHTDKRFLKILFEAAKINRRDN